MNPLNEYPTPETDAEEIDAAVNGIAGMSVSANHARDLERRLALCRDALKALHYECTCSDFNEHWDSYKNAEEALEATEAKR